MLKFLRNQKNQKKIWIGLALVIIPAFLSWGVIFSIKGQDDHTALGVFDGKKITIQQFLTQYRAVQHEFMLRFGKRYQEIAKTANLRAQTWDRILLLAYAKNEKINVNDREVVSWITSQPLFSNRGGFDDRFYKIYTANFLRMSQRDFEEEVRQNLMIEKIRESMRPKISVTDQDAQTLYESETKKSTDPGAAPPAAWDSLKKEEKELFKSLAAEQKSSEAMRALLVRLQKKLTLNLEVLDKLLPEEEK